MIRQQNNSPKLVLTLPEYQRMHSVIAAVLGAAEANTPKACLFFAVAGAYLIESIHKMRAHPMVGAAFYRIDDKTGFTTAYARMVDSGDGKSEVMSDEEAFHCWVQCDGMAIDLMAPIFNETIKADGRPEKAPRRMFQRPMTAMSTSPFELGREGDFFYQPDPVLGIRLMSGFMRRAENEDLVKICAHWYRPYPKPMAPVLHMGSSDGIERKIRLRPIELQGAW